MNRDEHDKPMLELLPGGRDASDDWSAFCARIGWQQLTEPALPADFEDRLARRIFGERGDNVVSLETARARRGLLPMTPDARPWLTRRRAGWGALAVVAIAAIGAALFAWGHGAAPPTADTVPAPVPERAPVAPSPDDEVEAPPQAPPPIVAPDPGARHARAKPRRRRMPEAVEASPPALERPAAPSRQTTTAPPLSPDGEARMAALAVPARLFLPITAGTGSYRGAARRSGPARAPSWRHLAPSLEAGGAHAMALVDVRAAGRRLTEL